MNCKICGKFNLSLFNYQQHVNSNGHRKRCLLESYDADKSTGYCFICDKDCGPYLYNLEQHRQSKAHLLRMTDKVIAVDKSKSNIILETPSKRARISSPPPPPHLQDDYVPDCPSKSSLVVVPTLLDFSSVSHMQEHNLVKSDDDLISFDDYYVPASPSESLVVPTLLDSSLPSLEPSASSSTPLFSPVIFRYTRYRDSVDLDASSYSVIELL